MRDLILMGVVVSALSGLAAGAPSLIFQNVESRYEMFVDVGNRSGDSQVASSGAITPGAISAIDGRVELASVEFVSTTISTAVNQSFSETAFLVSVSAHVFGASLGVAEEGDRIFVRASRSVVGTFVLTEDTYVVAGLGGTAGSTSGVTAGLTIGISRLDDPNSELVIGSGHRGATFAEAGTYSFTIRSFVEGEADTASSGVLIASASSTAQGFVRIVPAPLTAAAIAPVAMFATRRRR